MFQISKWCETRFYHVQMALQRVYRCSNERGENDREDGSEVSGRGESGDCLVSCIQILCFLWLVGERLEMLGSSVEVCSRGLKVNAGKSKVMVLGGEEGLECDWRKCR